jgi:hypothetical protein
MRTGILRVPVFLLKSFLDSSSMTGTEELREVAPWVERLARLGYTAKALLYGTIGVLAAEAALGSKGKVTDTRGALRTVGGQEFGTAFLLLIAIGFFGYAAWRLVEAVLDPERRGTDFKALATRAGFAIRGLVHGAFGITALRIIAGRQSGGGNQAQHWAARSLELPAGALLVAAAGLGIAGYGIYQLYRAWAAKLSTQLRLGQAPAGLRPWIVGVSRFGIAARGLVFCLIGWFLVQSGLRHDPGQAAGLRESLRALAEMGRWPFAAVALGLAAYGIYELVNARYRQIQVAR